MKPRSLRTVLAIRLCVLVAGTISLIGITADFMINARFESYITRRHKLEADGIAQNISAQYDAVSGGLNTDYVHGMGMYALNDGYIIRLQDTDGAVIWDAENHDMTLCHEVMQSVSVLMKKARPELHGDFLTHTYSMTHHGKSVGTLEISYYSPYYMRDNDFQFMSALNYVLVCVGGIALTAAIIISVLLANSIADPITETAEITRKISGGSYSIRIHEGKYAREISGLIRDVNGMAASLEEQEELRKRLTSDIAHELRTPVANLSSYMEMMIDDVWTPTTERLRTCYGELQRLSGVIADLEQLRQIECGNITLKMSCVDLQELARGVLDGFASSLQVNGLKAEITGKPSAAYADPDRMRQVLANLISNAVKYSHHGGTISITTDSTEDESTITVSDDGIGIPAQDLGRIFGRFYRTDRSRTRKTGGAGIGLTIAAEIVHAHGGTIRADSDGENGSRFVVTLPKRRE